MLIRPAAVADAAAILAIYNAEVLTSNVTFDLVPRTEAEQREWITDRSGAHIVVVTEDDDGAIVAFGALSPYRERPGYSTTAEDSIYVHADHRGRGLGKALLQSLIDTARAHGFHALMAKIVDGHERSIQLHGSLGFEVVGQEREVGRKFGRWHDVVLMELLL